MLRGVSSQGPGTAATFASSSITASSTATGSGNNNVNSTVITTSPASQSSQVTTAVLGQISYTGTGGFDAVGHNIGIYGYGLMNSAGQTAALIIANEGKITNLAGTLQNGVAFTAALSDCVAGTTTDNYVGYRSGGSGNSTATITNLSHFRSDAITTGTITNVLCFNAPDQTNFVSAAVGAYLQLSAGTGKYNIYAIGTAQNQLNGVTGIGIAPSSTAALTLLAGTTGGASLRIPHGAAPSAPVNGDMWTTTAGLFVRINGSTVGPLT